MPHSFVYVNGPRNQLIRACENCISTAIFDTSKEVWVPVQEQNGKEILGTSPCNGTPTEEKKSGFSAVDSKASTRTKSEPCYCAECKGKQSHYDGDSNCYCRGCRGKKSHY